MPGYAAYIACFVILARNRRAARPGLSRGMVLLILAEGLRHKQIAEKLCTSLDTVKSHVSRIYRKTVAAGRTELIYRIRLGRL